MPDEFNNRLERDLAQFRKRTSGSELENLRVILHDYSLSWRQLNDILTPSLFEFLLALLAPDSYGLLGGDIPKELSTEIASARILAERELRSFLKHPAIAQDLVWNEEYRRTTELVDSIAQPSVPVQIAGNAYFDQEEDKLTPRVELAMATRGNGPVLIIDVDPEDILMFVDDLLNICRREFERCEPMAQKDMLNLAFGQLVGRNLHSINENISRISELAARFGIELKKTREGTAE